MSTANGTAFTIDPKRAAESNAAVFTAVICVVWSLAFVTACVRFYTRAVVVRSFGKDDAFMVLAVVRHIIHYVWLRSCLGINEQATTDRLRVVDSSAV